MEQFFSDIESLNTRLGEITERYSSVFVLTDENTTRYCLPLVHKALTNAKVIQIQSGEINKTLGSCEQIWLALTEAHADRKSVLVNLGGGVITDMGGFAASCFKRGIDFINIPTTLLAMVDASVGGKTGIDFHNLKNQIGAFSDAMEVLICIEFLKTLDQRQLRSGMAEVLKHYLIADAESFMDYSRSQATIPDIDLIKKAVDIKSTICTLDPFERKMRKKLNFGHTIGHALESYSLTTTDPLLHGEAIAYGMAIETFIAVHHDYLDEEKAVFICHILHTLFDLKPLSDKVSAQILIYVLHDKKNEDGVINMALIDDIGSCMIDIGISSDEILEGIARFNNTLTHIL